MERPLFDIWPTLEGRLPWCSLGELPTPVTDAAPVLAGVDNASDLWIKRDDLSSPVYGGNKVRTLEALFGDAKHREHTWVYSTGAFGSNHAAATVMHAPRVGLASGVILFPQPRSQTAIDNLRATVGTADRVVALPHWSFLLFGMHTTKRFHRARNERAYVMVPGGATPLGALGYVSAAFELGFQVARGELPRPATIVIGVGSTCTSAGLLVGLHHAARLGIGFVDAAGRPAPPRVWSTRVTPWPVTAPFRIVSLASRASRYLARLAGDSSLAIDRATLRRGLHVDGRFLGGGYGIPTRDGERAIERFRAIEGLELDTTYSAKAGAAALTLAEHRAVEGPLLFWSTKSTAPLPRPPIDHPPSRMSRWLDT